MGSSNQSAAAAARGHLRLSFRRQKTNSLSEEPRRALAVFRALNFTKDEAAGRALLQFSGRPERATRDDALVISPRDCTALAGSLRSSGYPLTDDGIRLFKMERGFSNAVRIGPDVALAYGQYVRGLDARLNVGAEEWKRLTDEARNAIRLLLMIGRDPESFAAVRRVFGVRDSTRTQAGTILVGTVTAERLLRWASGHGWSLDRAGIARLNKARGVTAVEIDSELARFVADSILCRGEPAHNYAQVSCQGYTLNHRTVTMLRRAERAAGPAVWTSILKGSYVSGADRGAHPHMGGGVVDLLLSNDESQKTERAVAALRQAGFAAWYRARGKSPHIHAVAIGDLEASAAAQWQVKSYFQRRDGRCRSGKDPHRRLAIKGPSWIAKYRVACL